MTTLETAITTAVVMPPQSSTFARCYHTAALALSDLREYKDDVVPRLPSRFQSGVSSRLQTFIDTYQKMFAALGKWGLGQMIEHGTLNVDDYKEDPSPKAYWRKQKAALKDPGEHFAEGDDTAMAQLTARQKSQRSRNPPTRLGIGQRTMIFRRSLIVFDTDYSLLGTRGDDV